MKRSFCGGSNADHSLRLGESHDILYYNINITNNTNAAVPATTSELLTGPILTNAKKYLASCIRFVLDGSTIPIFHFEDGAYTVTITNGAAVSQQTVMWDPAYGSDEEVFSFTAFLEMVNTALTAAWGVVHGAFDINSPPYLVYVEATGTCPFFALATTAGSTVHYYMNNRLYGFFGNFLSIFNGENTVNGEDYEIVVKNLHSTNASSSNLFIPNGYLMMNQEYSSLALWYDITSIVFLSNTLGVKPEYLSTPNNTNNLTTNSSAGTGPAATSMITDFQPFITDSSGVRGYLYFAATGPWRMMNIQKDNINQIDLTIMLRDKVGNQYPYMLPAHQSVQLKIAFVPEEMYFESHKI